MLAVVLEVRGRWFEAGVTKRRLEIGLTTPTGTILPELLSRARSVERVIGGSIRVVMFAERGVLSVGRS